MRLSALPIVVSCAFLSFMSGCGKPAPGPVESEEHREHAEKPGTLDFSDAEIAASGIEVLAVDAAIIGELLPLYGTVQPNAERTRTVSARFAGVIQTVSAVVGDTVREGQVLATVESNESLRNYNVVAPLSGVVTARNANPGEAAGESPLFTVADLSTVWIELALFPRDFPRVRAGQEVRVRTVDGGLKGTGRIVYIAPVSQGGNQTLIARVLLENRERHWAPGLYVSAEVVLAERSVPLAVRNTALQRLNDDTVVFVRTDEGFAARKVITGASDSEWTQIQSGLSAAERYAAANSFVLKSDLGAAEADHEH
jgi:cobalt-zinc-cadmium efflux system membrane fusion protein